MYILEFHLMYVHLILSVVTHTHLSELYLKGSTAPSTGLYSFMTVHRKQWEKVGQTETSTERIMVVVSIKEEVAREQNKFRVRKTKWGEKTNHSP